MFWVQILCDDFNIVSWGFIVFCLVDLVVWTWNWTYFDWLWVMIEKWGYYWLLQVYFTAFLIATILLRIHFRQFLEAPTTRELGRGGGIVVITAFVVIFLCCSWAAARWLRWLMVMMWWWWLVLAACVLLVSVHWWRWCVFHWLWFDTSLRLTRHIRNISLHFAAAFLLINLIMIRVWLWGKQT